MIERKTVDVGGSTDSGRQTSEYRISAALRELLRRNLGGLEVRRLDDPALRPAAVSLVVAGDDRGNASVLLTRRPEGLRRHGGQYALPGGRVDPGETAEEAALRELREELGVDRGPDAILGTLDDFPTRSGFRITPFVVWGGAAPELRPDPEEVAAVFHIPLSELCGPGIPHLDDAEGGEQPVLSAPLPTLGHHVYAPTAAILYQFREVALLGRATRVAHYDQPRFAWK